MPPSGVVKLLAAGRQTANDPRTSTASRGLRLTVVGPVEVIPRCFSRAVVPSRGQKGDMILETSVSCLVHRCAYTGYMNISPESRDLDSPCERFEGGLEDARPGTRAS